MLPDETKKFLDELNQFGSTVTNLTPCGRSQRSGGWNWWTVPLNCIRPAGIITKICCLETKTRC